MTITTAITQERIGPPADIAERNAAEHAALRSSKSGYSGLSTSDGYQFTCPTCGAAPKYDCILTRGQYKGWPIGTHGGGAGWTMVPTRYHEMHRSRRALVYRDESAWATASSPNMEQQE